MDEADGPRRAALLAAVLTGQAVLGAGSLLVVAVFGGLDSLLFLAPVDWGLGFLVSKDLALGIGALLHVAGTAVVAVAAHAVRTGRDAAPKWTFLAAAACLTQLPAGVATAAYGLWLARRADYRDALRTAPVLAGRPLRRLVWTWIGAGSITIVLGAVGVALLFGPTVVLGLPLVLLAPGAQGALLVHLDRRIRAPESDVVPALPALPALPELPDVGRDPVAPDWTQDL